MNPPERCAAHKRSIIVGLFRSGSNEEAVTSGATSRRTVNDAGVTMSTLRRKGLPAVATAALILLSVSRVNGQTTGPDFYFNLGYGSEATFNPVTLVLNDAFDIVQIDGWTRQFSGHDYRTGWRTLTRSIMHPWKAISQAGAGTFIRSELLPLSTRASGGGQWLPNYQLHLVGGGMLYAMMTEWYRAHGFDHPTAWAIGTAVVERLINETVENGSFDGYSADNVADFYLFDAGGLVLFSFPTVRRFFSKRLRLRAWPLQPAIGLQEGTLENAGSYFSIQWKIPWSSHWHVFYYFGLNNMAGATYRLKSGLGISLGGGLQARRLITVDAATNRKTAELTGTAGVFIDRRGSLLASVTYSEAHSRRWAVNVYPGLLPPGNLSPGFWLQVTRDGVLIFGIGLRWAPGLSLTGR